MWREPAWIGWCSLPARYAYASMFAKDQLIWSIMLTSTAPVSVRALTKRTPASSGVPGSVISSSPQAEMAARPMNSITKRERRISSTPEKGENVGGGWTDAALRRTTYYCGSGGVGMGDGSGDGL